jgi:hypothetical protein
MCGRFNSKSQRKCYKRCFSLFLDVCWIRLDFETFQTLGPATTTEATGCIDTLTMGVRLFDFSISLSGFERDALKWRLFTVCFYSFYRTLYDIQLYLNVCFSSIRCCIVGPVDYWCKNCIKKRKNNQCFSLKQKMHFWTTLTHKIGFFR